MTESFCTKPKRQKTCMLRLLSKHTRKRSSPIRASSKWFPTEACSRKGEDWPHGSGGRTFLPSNCESPLPTPQFSATKAARQPPPEALVSQANKGEKHMTMRELRKPQCTGNNCIECAQILQNALPHAFKTGVLPHGSWLSVTTAHLLYMPKVLAQWNLSLIPTNLRCLSLIKSPS